MERSLDKLISSATTDEIICGKKNADSFQVASRKALHTIHALELSGCVYAIEFAGLPVWWFARSHVYNDLVSSLARANGCFVHAPSPGKRILTRLARAVVGCLRTNRVRTDKPVLFFGGSNGPWGISGQRRTPHHHVLWGDLYGRLGNTGRVFVEKPTDLVSDEQSLLRGSCVVFLDWALAVAALHTITARPRIAGVDRFIAEMSLVERLPIRADVLQGIVLNRIHSCLSKISMQLESARLLLDRLDPSIIVESCSYDSAAVALNLVAKDRRIPIIEIQHGILYEEHPGYSAYLPTSQSLPNPIPDRILVYGEWFRDSLVKASPALYKKENIRIAGSPRINRFRRRVDHRKSDEIRKSLRSGMGILPDEYLIVVTTQPIVTKQLVQFLSQVASILPEAIHVCVKLHPGEVCLFNSVYRSLSHYPRVTIVTDGSCDLYDLLASSDIHASVCSTVVLEAMALGVPNLIINLDSPLDLFDMTHSLDCQVVSTPEAFLQSCWALVVDRELRSKVIDAGYQISEAFFEPSVDFSSIALSVINELCQ